MVKSIDELHAEFGEPPSATLGRMRVPALGIDAPTRRAMADDARALEGIVVDTALNDAIRQADDPWEMAKTYCPEKYREG